MSATASSLPSSAYEREVLREMARTFGRVYHEGNRLALVFYIDGERYRIRSAPFDNGRVWVPLTEAIVEAILSDVRAKVRENVPPLAAIAPYLRSHAPQRTFRHLWGEFTEAKFRQGKAGEHDTGRQLSRERVAEIRGHERRGHLAPLLDLHVDRITPKVLDEWSAWLFKNKLSSGSVHHLVADVGTFLRWLERRQELARVPKLPIIRIRSASPKIPDLATQEALFRAIPWWSRGIFLVRGKHGLRPSEARRALVSDWNPTPAMVRLRDGGEMACHEIHVRGKDHRDRRLPVPAESELARWVLEHRSKAFGNEPLFRNPKADPDGNGAWTKSATRRVWLSACDVVFGKGKRPYQENQSMRHCYATALVNHGTALDAISAALGHTDIKTTKRYAQLGIGAHAGVLKPMKSPT